MSKLSYSYYSMSTFIITWHAFRRFRGYPFHLYKTPFLLPQISLTQTSYNQISTTYNSNEMNTNTTSSSSSSSPETTLILVNRERDGIAYVTINRPKSLNSLTRSMMVELAKSFKSLSSDESVRVIILSGSGRSFCSGVDLTAAEDVFKGDVKDMETDLVYQMERCVKPIIGAISGFAVTAGFEISLACDVLVASKDAKFLDTHARFGIFPSWGLSQKLSRIIGPNRAREVSLTATPITAEQAEKWGLVNHVVERSELLNKARQVAEAIIKNNQDMVLKYKAVINDGFKQDLGHALALEKERGHAYYNGMSKDHFKKMQEFIKGRGSSKASKPSSKL